MTYCVAMTVPEGLVFVSDSRTNAGIDQLATYSKMHQLLCTGERTFVLLSSGNLGTTQGVLSLLERKQFLKPVITLRTGIVNI